MDALIFDWDGTLFDSIGALYHANVVVMASYDLPFDEAAYRRHFAPDWRVMYANLGVPADRLDEANDRWHAAFAEVAATELLPGAADALRRARATGIPLALVTAGHRWLVEPQLRATGVVDLFDTAVFGDDTEAQKPDPAPLRLALERLGLAGRPARTAYLGDAPTDMLMARAVGVRAVGITSMLGDAPALLAAGAHEVAPSVAIWLDDAEANGTVPSPPPGRR